MLRRARPLLVALVGLRAVLAIVAIPLAPALYRDHIALLVLLRPTKEVLLLAGYVVHEQRANLVVLVLAALPLLVFAVWLFFGLGRSYSDEMEDAELPGVAGRVLPRERIQQLREVLGERGWSLVLLGRLAIMPSSLIAAAAGSSDMPPRTFVAADAAGALLSLAMMFVAGYVLEEARDQAGPWITLVGALALLGLLVLLGRKLRTSSVRREHAKAS